jgi:hypothetical protein
MTGTWNLENNAACVATGSTTAAGTWLMKTIWGGTMECSLQRVIMWPCAQYVSSEPCNKMGISWKMERVQRGQTRPLEVQNLPNQDRMDSHSGLWHQNKRKVLLQAPRKPPYHHHQILSLDHHVAWWQSSWSPQCPRHDAVHALKAVWHSPHIG